MLNLAKEEVGGCEGRRYEAAVEIVYRFCEIDVTN